MLVLVLVGAVVYVAFLGRRELWYPDEPDIAEVCRAMYVSGDWVAPRSMGQIWIDYPPFLYWAGCVSSHLLGGMTEFSLRLPSALGAILLSLVTCATVSRWFHPRAGFWSGLLLLTFAQFAQNAVAYRTDMLFGMAIGCGTLLYASGAGERARWWPRIGGFALLGVAVLVKGPVGLLLPGLVLVLWHASRREWSRIAALAPLTLVAIAVALPWYLACGHAMGFDNMWHEIHAQNFQRFDEGGRGHIRPWHYYLSRVWVDLAPWSFLLPFAIWWVARGERRRDRFVQLALWWFGTWFVFWTIAVTKREVYLIPAYAPAALLLGLYLAALGDGEPAASAGEATGPDPRPARVFAAAVGLLFAVVGGVAVLAAATLDLYLSRLPLDELTTEVARNFRVPGIVSGIALLAGGLWIFRGRRSPSPMPGLLRVAGVTVGFYGLLFSLLLPALGPTKSYGEASRWIRSQIDGEHTIGMLWPELGHHKMGAFSYYADVLVDLLATEADVERFFREHPQSVVLVHESKAAVLLDSTTVDWRARLVRELVGGRYRYLVFKAS